ncbi:Uncharacterised protein [Mycobacterium tuberculosis]|jgi:hypothetical protein|nr:Uncharacterised protein [Mycobacterium tuberculosis]
MLQYGGLSSQPRQLLKEGGVSQKVYLESGAARISVQNTLYLVFGT